MSDHSTTSSNPAAFEPKYGIKPFAFHEAGSSIRLTRGFKRFLAGVALVGVVGAGAAVELARTRGPEFSTAQLSNLPTSEQYVNPHEGAAAVIERVDPLLANDGRGLEEVEQFVGPAIANGSLEVPIIPSEQAPKQ